jgi:hypothetical protein
MSSADALKTDRNDPEGLLSELAAELRHVPVEEATRELHTRALQLRAVVAMWSANPPDETARRATCDEILALHREARESRFRLRSGAWLVRAR